jgi:hypothetical protein
LYYWPEKQPFYVETFCENNEQISMKILHVGTNVCDAETWILRKLDQKYLESFELLFWSRKEEIIWTDRVRNAMLGNVNEEKNILHTVQRRTANRIGHTLRRNWLIKHAGGENIEERYK